MTSYSPRVRGALAGVLALTAVAAVALVVHEPSSRNTVLSESTAAQSASVADDFAEETTSTTEAPTTTTSTTSAPATTVATTPRTTAPPAAVAPASTVTTTQERIRRTALPKNYVDCHYVDQGNGVGTLQLLAVSAPALPSARFMYDVYFPVESTTRIPSGTTFTDLDAAGNGMIRFATNPAMVGKTVRIEAHEYLLGSYNNADQRHCTSATFTVPPPG